ncbi:MAG: hypothetical protein HFJ45_02535 [Clostridia bacterium]|nr:hypothetical protein [Clostridia bacterium]
MNINQNINKLLYALSQKGQFYKINSFQFYNEKNNKYCTKYQVLKRELVPIDVDIELDLEEIEYEEKYKVDYVCYSKIEMMEYLADEYKEIGSEADGR